MRDVRILRFVLRGIVVFTERRRIGEDEEEERGMYEE
jgi:hypothetical protein